MEQSVFQRNFINAKNHWWWLARKKILQEVISKQIKKKENLNIYMMIILDYWKKSI